jgi:hypothetical protein
MFRQVQRDKPPCLSNDWPAEHYSGPSSLGGGCEGDSAGLFKCRRRGAATDRIIVSLQSRPSKQTKYSASYQDKSLFLNILFCQESKSFCRDPPSMVSTIHTVYGGKRELIHRFAASGRSGQNLQNISLGGLSTP